MPDQLEARCDTFVGAMAALTALLEGQVPGLSLPSEQVAPLLAMLSAEAAALRAAMEAGPAARTETGPAADTSTRRARPPCNDL